jgi:hypothetical protein
MGFGPLTVVPLSGVHTLGAHRPQSIWTAGGITLGGITLGGITLGGITPGGITLGGIEPTEVRRAAGPPGRRHRDRPWSV